MKRDPDFLLNSYLEVMRTTRQRWWQIWKPGPNAIELGVIAAHQAESRFTCLYTGPENDPPMPKVEITPPPDFDK